jgi:hypothetical protein
MSKRTIIIIFIILGILLGAGLLVYQLIPHGTLKMSVAPDEVTVTINGKERSVTTGDSIRVDPGELTIKISRDEFDPYTEKLTIKNGETVEILVALYPKTSAAKELLGTEKSDIIIQRLTGRAMEKNSAQLRKEYPIISSLPIRDKYYMVTICDSRKNPEDKTKVAICIELYEPAAKQSAIDDVKSRGFNLDDYETYFVDARYDSPSQTHGD